MKNKSAKRKEKKGGLDSISTANAKRKVPKRHNLTLSLDNMKASKKKKKKGKNPLCQALAP